MGCIFSWFRRSNNQQPLENVQDEAPKVYSWDVRDRSKSQDFIIQDLKGETVGRMPGSVNGQQLVIQNCQDCNIYIFDYSATITIDDCTNCNFFIGPVKQSLFIRDCQQCRFVLACMQFRTRDCRHIDVFSLCESQPIIESSSKMRFACFKFFYPELEGQFKASGLSVFNNNWSNLHDFTPVPDEAPNFSFLPEDAKVEDFVPLPTVEPFSTVQIITDSAQSVVPQTHGRRRKPHDESCLIVFFNDGSSYDRANKFIDAMRKQNPDCILIQSRELTMQPEDATRVFGSDSYVSAVKQGPVIGVEYCGEEVVRKCQDRIVDIMTGTTGVVFVSQNPASAQRQIDNFFNFADMQMGL
ncbi:protein XRP2-like [Littorina saxatilis]|uniref:Protein XRP2 n=1 Tax=Littorina saxatilis TaxID=31220 RepID=A0AAN9G958_9CAEN